MKYYLVDDRCSDDKPKVMDEQELRVLSWNYECLDLKDNMEFYKEDSTCIDLRVKCLNDCINGDIEKVIWNLYERGFAITIIDR